MKITDELIVAEKIINKFIEMFDKEKDYELERFHVYTNVEKEKAMFTNVLQLIVSKGKSSVMLSVPYSNNERWLRIYNPSEDATVKHNLRNGKWVDPTEDYSEMTYEDIYLKVCNILNK